MLTSEQILEIRDYLENSRNPIFFFDNDCDGLCSFLLLQRFLGRGRGVSLKGLPSLNKSYYKKAEDFDSDLIVVLDRPGVDREVIEVNKKGRNIPIICIDHHKAEEKPEIEGYYNTFYVDGNYDPTSYLCYSISGKKDDMWLAVIGCIGDWFMPDFLGEFRKKYPELIDRNYEKANDIMYKTELGKIAMIFDLSLKDTTTNTVSLLKFLMKAQGPKDILEENSKTEGFLKRYELLNKIVKKNIEKAEKDLDKKDKFLFFIYSGDMSLSQHIANELAWKYPDFRLAIGYVKGGFVKFSLRGDRIRTFMVFAIKDIEGARGGGHEFSCGAQMSAEFIEKFKEGLLQEIRKFPVSKKPENI